MDVDAIVHPRGPLPASIYWRRRAVLLGVLLVAVLLLRSCVGGGGDGSATLRGAGSSATPSSTAGSPARSAAASRAPVASGSPGAPCRLATLQIGATTDARSYPAGVRPKLTLSVRNVGPTSCRIDLGQPARELRIVSGTDRVWSSDDCSQGGGSNPVALQSGEIRSFSVTWFRRRSAPGCVGGQPSVPPGTYRVIGRIGDFVQGGDPFSLR
ncbi:MAG: hypothetical protein ABR520_05495 [Mycobacteriales bacterium]